MSDPRPLKESYDITIDTKKDIKSTIKPLVDFAIRGNPRFVTDFTKINWTSLSAKNVLDMIILLLSYGLKTNKELFEKYIRKENMKGNVSLFSFMQKYDGVRLKNCLKSNDFREIFSSLFNNTNQDVDWEKELNELCMRVAKITKNNITPEDIANLTALIDSIFSGKNVEPNNLNDEIINNIYY